MKSLGLSVVYDCLSEGSREGRLQRPKAAGATVQALGREYVKVFGFDNETKDTRLVSAASDPTCIEGTPWLPSEAR